MLKSGPGQIEFGHVCEDPHEWEQRYEKKDLAKQRHQGQVAGNLFCLRGDCSKRLLALSPPRILCLSLSLHSGYYNW